MTANAKAKTALAVQEQLGFSGFSTLSVSELRKSLTRKKYLAIEKKMEKFGDTVSMTQAELDLYLWYMKTGEVLK